MEINDNCTVILSTSCAGNYSANNVLCNNGNMFYVTSGLYPQEIVIKLSTHCMINSITLTAIGISKIEFLVCESSTNLETALWRSVFISDANEADPLEFQRLSVDFPRPNTSCVSLLKIRILSGYQEFAVIKQLCIIGNVIKLLSNKYL